MRRSIAANPKSKTERVGRSASAFTLVELLAVLILLSMAASLGLAMLAGAGNKHDAARTVAALRSADTAARLRAMLNGHVTLRFVRRDQDSLADAIVLEADLHDSRSRRFELAAPAALTPAQGDAPESMLFFDGRGETRDYAVAIFDGSHRQAVAFNGLTGHMTTTSRRGDGR